MCKHKPSESSLRPTRPGPEKLRSMGFFTILTKDAGHNFDGSEIRRSTVDMENLPLSIGII